MQKNEFIIVGNLFLSQVNLAPPVIICLYFHQSQKDNIPKKRRLERCQRVIRASDKDKKSAC